MADETKVTKPVQPSTKPETGKLYENDNKGPRPKADSPAKPKK